MLRAHIAVAAGLLASRSGAARASQVLTSIATVLLPEIEREARIAPKRFASLRQLAMRFCDEEEISLGALLGPGRHQGISRLRQAFMAEVYDTKQFSLPQIGRFLARDHTTILHGVRVHKARVLDEERAGGALFVTCLGAVQ